MRRDPDRLRNDAREHGRVPRWLWDTAAAAGILVLGLTLVLFIVAPKEGLKLWWDVLVPSLPLIWLVAPGLWRNVCPLAALNQFTRRTGVSLSLTPPSWWKESAQIVGMAVFLAAVAARPDFLDTSPTWATALICGAVFFALIGGLVFKGKSGWCTSLCPMLPVERLYGQTPLADIQNVHCAPCIGCTQNCYDFNARTAWLIDLRADERRWINRRAVFAGAFLGAVIAYVAFPAPLSMEKTAIWFLIAMGLGVGAFYILQALLNLSFSQVTALYAASAISIFYWHAAPIMATALFSDPQHWFSWLLRGVVWALALLFVWRTWKKEAVFRDRLRSRNRSVQYEGASRDRVQA